MNFKEKNVYFYFENRKGEFFGYKEVCPNNIFGQFLVKFIFRDYLPAPDELIQKSEMYIVSQIVKAF